MSGRGSCRLLLSFLAFPALILAGATACQPAPTPPHNDSSPRRRPGEHRSRTAAAPRPEPPCKPVNQPRPAGRRCGSAGRPRKAAPRASHHQRLPVAVEAYTGTTWGHLPEVGSDHDGSSAFRVESGTAYSIRMTGLSGGAFTLKWANSSGSRERRGRGRALSSARARWSPTPPPRPSKRTIRRSRDASAGHRLVPVNGSGRRLV